MAYNKVIEGNPLFGVTDVNEAMNIRRGLAGGNPLFGVTDVNEAMKIRRQDKTPLFQFDSSTMHAIKQDQSKWIYDPFEPEDDQRKAQGIMPKAEQAKYKTNDPVDMALLQGGYLPRSEAVKAIDRYQKQTATDKQFQDELFRKVESIPFNEDDPDKAIALKTAYTALKESDAYAGYKPKKLEELQEAYKTVTARSPKAWDMPTFPTADGQEMYADYRPKDTMVVDMAKAVMSMDPKEMQDVRLPTMEKEDAARHLSSEMAKGGNIELVWNALKGSVDANDASAFMNPYYDS